MALGTPVAAAVAYSAQNGTSVSPAYPTGILASDVILLITGQKPSTANGGTVTTPSGWTLREEILAQGGYGTTLGAGTGNTNLRIYSWNTPVAGQTGNLAVTLGTNNVSWAFMIRIPKGAGAAAYGSADGSRATAPTANTPFTVNLTNGTSATNFQSGDLAIWAMCIPDPATTPSQFSAHSVTATGATFATAVEFNEPDSTTGNDIAGFSTYASCSSGSSTAAPSITVTASGTVTNVRGPIAMVRVREAPAPQTLTPNLFTNTNTFHNPTVTRGTVNLSPTLYTNNQTFYGPEVTQGGSTQALTVSLYTNDQTFYGPTVTRNNTLAPNLYINTETFYAATVNRGTVTLTPARYDNANTFYAPTVERGVVALTPLRYDNANTFYSSVITADGTVLIPALLENTQIFYSPSVTTTTVLIPARFDNSSTFYSEIVTNLNEIVAPLLSNNNTFFAAQILAEQPLAPALVVNANEFFGPVVAIDATELVVEDYVTPGYVASGYVEFSAFNVNQFFVSSSQASTIIVLTGAQAQGLVGYVNFSWSPVPSTQNANWGEVGDGQDANWQSIVNDFTPIWTNPAAAPNANWQPMATGST